MLELFGKKYQLNFIVFSFIFVISIAIILLNVTYFIWLGSSLMNLNMGVGCILVIYSYRNLFVKIN